MTERYLPIPLELRWSDQDLLGHVNNARIVTLMEEARVRWSRRQLAEHESFGGGLVVASLTVDYLRQLDYRPDMTVLVGVVRIGNRSFTDMDPRELSLFTLLRIVPGLVLFGSLYLLFYSLTPHRYRKRGCLKWPGALFVTLWWLATTALLPVALSSIGGYDLTYGSLAGVMIALIFFFIIGLGVVIGAELNAALADTPEEGLKEGEEAFYVRESV